MGSLVRSLTELSSAESDSSYLYVKYCLPFSINVIYLSVAAVVFVASFIAVTCLVRRTVNKTLAETDSIPLIEEIPLTPIMEDTNKV